MPSALVHVNLYNTQNESSKFGRLNPASTGHLDFIWDYKHKKNIGQVKLEKW